MGPGAPYDAVNFKSHPYASRPPILYIKSHSYTPLCPSLGIEIQTLISLNLGSPCNVPIDGRSPSYRVREMVTGKCSLGLWNALRLRIN